MTSWLITTGIVLSLIVSAGGGYTLVVVLFRLTAKENPTNGATVEESPGDALRRGTWIGVLERLATTSVIIVGQPMLIGVIVVIKGFGRFDQLKGNPAASEKFTVGTLASLLWAGAVGTIANLLIGLPLQS